MDTRTQDDLSITVGNLPPPANKIVTAFVNKICNIEEGFIEGVYLIGSLKMHDFHSNKSDIDFLVLCKYLPNTKILTHLKNIHKTIDKKYPKPELNGSYLTTASLKIKTPEDIKVLSYHQGSLRRGNFEMFAISLWELKQNAITIIGPKAETLPVDITGDQVKKFMYHNINTYWKKWIDRHSSFFKRRILLLLFPTLTEWSVLGVARLHYTLQTGQITSKMQAGIYCLEHMPEKFHPIIKEAIEIRKVNRSYHFVQYQIEPSRNRMTQTIACVNYMIRLFNKIYTDKQH